MLRQPFGMFCEIWAVQRAHFFVQHKNVIILFANSLVFSRRLRYDSHEVVESGALWC